MMAEYPFVCLLAICIFSLEKFVFMSFAFLKKLFLFLFMECRSSLYIVCVLILYKNYKLHFTVVFLICWLYPLVFKNLWFWDNLDLSILLFCHFQEINVKSKACSPCIKNFKDLYVYALVYFNLIFMYNLRIQLLQHHYWGLTNLSAHAAWHSVKCPVSYYCMYHDSTIAIYFLYFIPRSHWLNSAVSFKAGSGRSSILS